MEIESYYEPAYLPIPPEVEIPESPEEHAPDCCCSACKPERFFRGISEAILAHVLATEVPEADGQPKLLKSYRNPSIYAGSEATSTDLFTGTRRGSTQEKGRRRCSRPAPEPTGDILTPEQVAQRLQVGVRWV